MTASSSARSGADMAIADPLSRTVGPIDDVLITEELARRPSRAPDHEAESRALGALAREMVASPGTVLQKLVELIIEVDLGESAGVSILKPDDWSRGFHWSAVAGRWDEHLGGTMPFDASPCGTVVMRDTHLLFALPHEHFPATNVEPLIREILLVPFHVGGEPVGTVWAITHDPQRGFDAEDLRLLTSLGRFASVAYQMTAALDRAEAARDDLERRVEERTHALSEANEALRREAVERASAEAAVRESEARVAADLAGMQRLYDLHAKLAGETDSHVALRDILAAAVEFTGTGRGTVQLVSDDGERLEIVAHHGYGQGTGFTEHFRRSGSLPAYDAASRLRQRLIVDDVETFPALAGTKDREVALADGIRATQSTPMVSRKGEVVGVLSTQFPRPHRPGDPELRLIDLLAWTAADVVERHRAEAALRESEAQFRQFADASTDVLWIRDAGTLRFNYVGPAFERVYGDSFARVFAGNDLRRWLELIVPEDRKLALGNLRRVRRGERVTHEFRIRRPSDGALRWVRNTDFPLLDEQERVRSIAGIGQDVTAAKLAGEALRGLNEALETRAAERTGELMAAEAMLRQAQKMEAVGQLTGGIAHDFNNMLQGISNALELMHRRAEQGRLPEAGLYLKGAQETVRRAAALTHRLLAFARQQTLAPAPVNLDKLAVDMAELIGRTVGPQVQVELRLGAGCGPVLCDESQLENALLNLAVNARDAMPDGGWLTISTGEARLSAADLAGEPGLLPGAYAALTVADTGAGMDEATRVRAFEPFFTSKPLGQGTGLGLSQIYGFVRQSGGFVQIESALGQGTTVRLYLPHHEAAEADARNGEAAAGAVVLLVEDEEGLRAMAAEWLREAGHRVLEAPDGPAALRLLAGGGRLDALVTDVGLPGGMNGRQVAEAARARRPGLPVLFMTGYAGSVLDSQLAPGMDVIAKPFALDALAERVRAILEEAAPAAGAG